MCFCIMSDTLFLHSIKHHPFSINWGGGEKEREKERQRENPFFSLSPPFSPIAGSCLTTTLKHVRQPPTKIFG
jgi:hypothetical protein